MLHPIQFLRQEARDIGELMREPEHVEHDPETERWDARRMRDRRAVAAKVG